jgi:integrase/recombinase XerD
MSGTGDTLVVFEGPADLAALSLRLASIFLPDARASERFWEFFAANIRNKNTRRAYCKDACRFSDWCEGRGLFDLAKVKPLYAAAYIEDLQRTHSKRSVKQHLAALRRLIGW